MTSYYLTATPRGLRAIRRRAARDDRASTVTARGARAVLTVDSDSSDNWIAQCVILTDGTVHHQDHDDHQAAVREWL